MTTATRTPPQHGERRCYLRGCRRPECLDAHYRYMSRIRLEYAHGQKRRVSADATHDHVQQLVDAGWNFAQISRASGIARRTISPLAIRRYPTTSRNVERAILAVPLGPPPRDQQDTDATGTVRRIRALLAIGHTSQAIADAVGMHRDALNKIARHELPCVRATTARAVASAYRQLALAPGMSVRGRAMAARKGWHGPLAWDETTIDDPEAQPETDGAEQELNRDQLAALRRSEAAHLAQFGVSAHEIAERLDMALSTVQAIVAELRTGQRRDRTKAAA
ncbi:hypothetical protein ACFCX0_03760 [Streptomyces sp. NPDC056352]|uniref:hypothetical protein n=1 Tax=Streptomyces sp. NPDC056352 TaxID=3345791 RepID=UPI0035DB2968